MRSREPVQYVTVAQINAHDDQLIDAVSQLFVAVLFEIDPLSRARWLSSLRRSSDTPVRKKLLAGIKRAVAK